MVSVHDYNVVAWVAKPPHKSELVPDCEAAERIGIPCGIRRPLYPDLKYVVMLDSQYCLHPSFSRVSVKIPRHCIAC